MLFSEGERERRYTSPPRLPRRLPDPFHQKGRDFVTLNEEQRLISIGYPLEEAFGICRSLRREGGLREFVEAREAEHRERCREYVREVIG